jgi:hypothetical protein
VLVLSVSVSGRRPSDDLLYRWLEMRNTGTGNSHSIMNGIILTKIEQLP